jgi:hypothetical protein
MVFGHEQWQGKKIKIEEQAIIEILIADTDSELGDEAIRMLKNILREKKQNNNNYDNNNNNKPPQKSKDRRQQVVN